MAFVRKRKSGEDSFSYQLIETFRDGDRIKQRVLANLGPCDNVRDAVLYWLWWANDHESSVTAYSGRRGKWGAFRRKGDEAELIRYTKLRDRALTNLSACAAHLTADDRGGVDDEVRTAIADRNKRLAGLACAIKVVHLLPAIEDAAPVAA